MNELYEFDIIYDANVFNLDLDSSSIDNDHEHDEADIDVNLIDSMNIDLIDIEISEKSSRPSKSLIDIDIYKKYISTKDRINTCQKWEKWSKLTNVYEKMCGIIDLSSMNIDSSNIDSSMNINLSSMNINSSSMNGRSKSSFSRAYPKILEIIRSCDITSCPKTELETGSESSGSGSESITKALFVLTSDDLVKLMPKNSINYIYKNKSVGSNSLINADSTTSLNELDNLPSSIDQMNLNTIDNFKDPVDLFVAEGSANVTHDPNNQEQLNLYTIFFEIIFAVNQKVGSTAIIKVFDLITRPSVQLLYYLTKLYHSVQIIKPRTSRITSSEKYLVLKNFKGIPKRNLDNLRNALNIWNSNPNGYCRSFGIDIPESFEKLLHRYNCDIINLQIRYIERAIYYSHNDDKINENFIYAFQNRKAYDLCKLLGIIPNDNSECKHSKKSKNNQVNDYLKVDLFVCDKCFELVL
jgi:23S rRNA U2552 (ribose-2'-O)-methylase RlmE/FtsJ